MRRTADAHDAGPAGVAVKFVGSLMLILPRRRWLEKRRAADAHDAGPTGPTGVALRNAGSLMLMLGC